MRLLIAFAVRLIVTAVALFVASVVLDDFEIDTLSFPIVVVVFTLIDMIADPVVERYARIRIVRSFVGLLAAFVTLLLTDLILDGLDIEGVTTWVLASLVVWIGAVLANLLLGRRLLRRWRADRGAARG